MLYEVSSCFRAGTLGPFLAPGAPKMNPWLVPRVEGVIQSIDPLCSNMDIPLQEAARSQLLREKKLHFKPSDVLGVSLCPVRHTEVLPGLMEEREEAFLGQNILKDTFQGAFHKSQPLVTQVFIFHGFTSLTVL